MALVTKKNRQGTTIVSGRTAKMEHPKRWSVDKNQNTHAVEFRNGIVGKSRYGRVVNA